jgi:hypothetical protein
MDILLSGYLESLKESPQLISQAATYLPQLLELADREVRDQLGRTVSARRENTRRMFPGSLFLFEEDDVVVSLRRLSEPSPHLHLVPRLIAFIPLSGTLQIEEYRVDRGEGQFHTDIFTGRETATFLRTAAFAPGQIYVRDDPTLVFDVHGSGQVISIYAGLLGRLDWSFDRASGKALGVAASDPRDTDIEALLGIVKAMGPDLGEEAIAPALKHPSYFVRWAALQALNEVRPQSVRAWLPVLAADPHPEIAGISAALLRQTEA